MLSTRTPPPPRLPKRHRVSLSCWRRKRSGCCPLITESPRRARCFHSTRTMTAERRRQVRCRILRPQATQPSAVPTDQQCARKRALASKVADALSDKPFDGQQTVMTYFTYLSLISITSLFLLFHFFFVFHSLLVRCTLIIYLVLLSSISLLVLPTPRWHLTIYLDLSPQGFHPLA